jgi:N-acetylmuramic acid 6-phosphate etherase
MSGTSVDGIDLVVVKLADAPPQLQWSLLGSLTLPYPPPLRQAILQAMDPDQSRVDQLCCLNFALGHAFADAVLQGLAKLGIPLPEVDLIASHGQTVWHAPQEPMPATLQLGEAAVIAERTGIPVVHNFRVADMAAGGQGAPLVAYADLLLFTHIHQDRAAQNIGGMANVTYLPALVHQDRQAAFAFDTGPGNVLIDAAVHRMTQGQLTFDRDGQMALQGQVHSGLLAELMAHPYLQQSPPKTTGREMFGATYFEQIWERGAQLQLSEVDRVATLTALTADSMVEAYRRFLPQLPQELILSGGGAHNPVIRARLEAHLPSTRIVCSDQLGIPMQAKEALAFAVLAYETWHQRPGNLPAATGASHPVLLGQITLAPHPIQKATEAGAAMATLTEAVHPATLEIDRFSPLEIVEVMNAEDSKIAAAVAAEKQQIAAAIEKIAERMRRGGRLIYIGAGTSGRLGVLDASECPPTFNTDPGQVLGVIAGGETAIRTAVEGAEDSPTLGTDAIQAIGVTPEDCIVGIAASGQTPYVVAALQEAKRLGALTISLTCNQPSPLASMADITIAPLVGAEVIMGSTRLKAGTAQKMVLNMLSTGVMIQLGKTFGNLMVDLQATNTKLKNRCRRILEIATGLDPGQAQAMLDRCHGNVKVALIATLATISPETASQFLERAEGSVRQALWDIEIKGNGDSAHRSA